MHKTMADHDSLSLANREDTGLPCQMINSHYYELIISSISLSLEMLERAKLLKEFIIFSIHRGKVSNTITVLETY